MRTTAVILVILIGLVVLDSYQYGGKYLKATMSMTTEIFHHVFP